MHIAQSVSLSSAQQKGHHGDRSIEMGRGRRALIRPNPKGDDGEAGRECSTVHWCKRRSMYDRPSPYQLLAERG